MLLLKDMTEYQKRFFKKLYKIDDDIIEEIARSRHNLAKTITQGSLDQEFITILDIISGKKKKENFYGKEADKLIMMLKKKSKETNKNEEEL